MVKDRFLHGIKSGKCRPHTSYMFLHIYPNGYILHSFTVRHLIYIFTKIPNQLIHRSIIFLHALTKCRHFSNVSTQSFDTFRQTLLFLRLHICKSWILPKWNKIYNSNLILPGFWDYKIVKKASCNIRLAQILVYSAPPPTPPPKKIQI